MIVAPRLRQRASSSDGSQLRGVCAMATPADHFSSLPLKPYDYLGTVCAEYSVQYVLSLNLLGQSLERYAAATRLQRSSVLCDIA